MGKKKKSGYIDKSALPKSNKKNKFIDNRALALENFDKEGNASKVLISIKHLQPDFECFSEWTKQEMQLFWSFNSDLHNKSWQQVYSTARKSKKTGLAYTVLSKKQYPKSNFTKLLSRDITLFELRVNKKIRVHGFRHKFIFHICWLDKNHNITD